MRRLTLLLSSWILMSCHEGADFDLVDDRVSTCEQCNEAVDVRTISLGVGFGCALDGLGGVRCWGRSEYGVLGSAPREAPIEDASKAGAIDFGTSRRVVGLSAGWQHVCVLFQNQRARCWGHNQSGQLGLGNTDDYGDDADERLSDLDDVPLERIASISAGVRSTCAIVGPELGAPGEVHCWGSDQGGALGDRQSGGFGDDEPIDASRPVPLPADAVTISTGADLACALLTNGAVHCWGDNWAGTLGIGELNCDIGDEQACISELGKKPDMPVTGLGTRTITTLNVNQTSACVVDNSGDVLCWGRNSQSRLGYPEFVEGEIIWSSPGAISLGNTISKQIALGLRHSCVLDVEGRVRCFGERGPALGYGMEQGDGVAGIGGTQTPEEAFALRNDDGVIDIGDFDEVAGMDSVRAIAAGATTTCALLDDGEIRCWGQNAYGDLGYGDPAQVGAIGDDASPGEEYERLGRAGALRLEPPETGE